MSTTYPKHVQKKSRTCPKIVRNKSGPRGQMKIKQNVDHHKAKRQGQRQQGQCHGQGQQGQQQGLTTSTLFIANTKETTEEAAAVRPGHLF